MVKIVYKALVSAPSKPDKKYFSTAETTIKDSETKLRHKTYVSITELSKYLCILKYEKKNT